MKRTHRLIVAALILAGIAGLRFSAWRKTSDTPLRSEPAKVEPISGTDLKRLTLTEEAAQRLGIETAPVREEKAVGSDRIQKVVPYAALLYGLHGETWVYTSPEPLTFIRHPILIDSIDGDLAVLSEGPPPDTEVVTVGVAELYGIDTGVGK